MSNSPTELRKVYQEADCLHTEAEVLQAISKMAQDIDAVLSESQPLVLTVMNGGLALSGQLLTKMSFPLEVDYIHATRYGDKTTGDKLEWIAKPRTSLKNRTVLIVDDILDQGNTLLELIEYCEKQGAHKVLSAVLVDKIHDRKAKPTFKADFTGLEVIDRFIFGFGMDYKGYWRNAPGIFAVKGL